MRRGLVYSWNPDAAKPLGGSLAKATVPLEHLDTAGDRLSGSYVRVRNAGWVNQPGMSGGVRPIPIGNAKPDAKGDFVFQPGRGGGRLDKANLVPDDMTRRYVQASHFGEVNTYYHLDRGATYVDQLLHELETPSLPILLASVNAHHAVTENNGVRDGVRRGDRWLPFQGGHYRLPGEHLEIQEHEAVSPYGEIHLGPGWQLLHYGALVELAGGPYRSNSSHNAGIIYHEYGHHITRHTADLRANSHRPVNKQSNRKTALDEGFSDYWAATMLGTPHIWAWHKRHDNQEIHSRSLVSKATMADYDDTPGADAHSNGTIWAAALWELREQLRPIAPLGARQADLLVLKTLILLGQTGYVGKKPRIRNICVVREKYPTALAALLEAEKLLFSRQYHDLVLECFSKRGIKPDPSLRINTDLQLGLKPIASPDPSVGLARPDEKRSR